MKTALITGIVVAILHSCVKVSSVNLPFDSARILPKKTFEMAGGFSQYYDNSNSNFQAMRNNFIDLNISTEILKPNGANTSWFVEYSCIIPRFNMLRKHIEFPVPLGYNQYSNITHIISPSFTFSKSIYPNFEMNYTNKLDLFTDKGLVL